MNMKNPNNPTAVRIPAEIQEDAKLVMQIEGVSLSSLIVEGLNLLI
jgi:hypothetical protein